MTLVDRLSMKQNHKRNMKKTVLLTVVALLMGMDAMAQENDVPGVASVAVGVGMTGITADLNLRLSPNFSVRGGADIMTFKYGSDLEVEYRNSVAQRVLPETFAVTGKLSMTTGHVLFDLYPSKESSFRFTAGAYLGTEKVAEAYNSDEGALLAVTAYNRMVPDQQKAGYLLGDYFLTPDEKGNVNANIKTSKLRPYVGIGFGRTVPAKGKIGLNLDLGVQFWGKPKVECQGQDLADEDLKGDDGGIVRHVSNMSVWPVVNLRVVLPLF